MENKKANCNFNSNNITPNVEVTLNEAIPKHQHNTAPQNLRLLQYGLKIPNHQHIQINQQLNTSAPPQHLHIHQHQNVQHQQQPQQQTQQQLQFQPAQTLRQNINQKYVQPHQHKSQIPNPLYGQSMYQTTQTPPPPPPLHGHQMMQNTPQIWMPHQPPPIHYHNQQQQQQKELQSQKTPTTPVTPTVPKKENDKKKSGGTQLRSPSAKRPPEAPVTMQGWLHKQGSEGLMLWKKRWFVLSEYCLFYYKGSEEEKLLGSILLPSYKVSICGPEDKVNKKYAFKCEHANMRTYILAADSHELMMQWVRVLNLACMLESHNENETLTVSMPEEKIPLSLQQQQQQIRNTPVHNHSSSNTTELSNPSQQEFQYNQPLYANAPPKPRRLNDTSGYYSPSPEVMDRYPNPQIYARNLAKSPVNYGHNMMTPEYVHRPKHNIYDYYPPNIVPQNAERRTPDTYGRSKLSTPKRQHQTDYEDVYGEMYKRPLSPVAYNHQMIKKSPYPSPYMPVNNIMGPDLMSKYPVQMRKSPSIARPHSADFLEYEVNHRQNNTATRQQPRPKSSLDINRHENSNDNYFYSEERYAEKMRKSAQYLQNMPRYQTENTFPLMRSNTQPLHLNLPPFNNNTNQEQRVFNQPVRSRSVLSEGSLSKELDADLVASTKELDRGPSPGYSQQRKTDYDQFTRSASARLTHNLNEDKSLRDGDRKREESMKRLLEWKQRMLQSPLNRKAQAQSNRSFHPKPDHYYQDNNIYLMQKIEQDGRRSVTNLPQYNSYSSDDEENVARSKDDNVHTQAGRTLDDSTYSNNYPPAQITSTTVFNTQEPDKPLITNTTTSTTTQLHDNNNKQTDKDTVLTEPLKQFNKDSSTVAHVSSLRSEYSDKFEQSLIVTEIKSNGALVKSILAEFEKKSDDKADLPDKEPVTPTKDIDLIMEENYMTMTPKKSVLDPNNVSEPEENPYVEMTQNVDSSLLKSEAVGEQQPYELVCFSQGRLEPVYMELNASDASKELPDILLSPKRSSSIKSDSSDADDEASKDLDSLDTPSRSRFSLSDTFRPASYYLGASQATVPEFPDSSDSELVSPPPIPTSPPSLDLDLENAESNSTKDETYGFNPKLRNSLDKKLYDTDVSSICSGTVTTNENYRSSRNSDSEIELRMRLNNYEKMLKRRPVSEEFCNRLEMDSNIDPDGSVDLDRYLQDLEITNGNLDISNQCHDYENMFIASPYKIPTEKEDKNVCPNSSASAELCNLSTCSSPNSIRLNSSLSVPTSYFTPSNNNTAPYYYSDLSINNSDTRMLTLNNQRDNNCNGKKDITHIVNPLKDTGSLQNDIDDTTFKLAAEARSVSVDFLNLTDKADHIDKKNIYESDTLKRQKATVINSDTRNLYATGKNDKFNAISNTNDSNLENRRSQSLEGLLENVLNIETESIDRTTPTANNINNIENAENDGESSYWEEDSLWRERLRSASQRHTKSMENLDSLNLECKKTVKNKSPRGIIRGATYVNDNIFNMPVDMKPKVEEQETPKKSTETRNESTFIIDREKLRQWDLLSSAPSDDQLSAINNNSNNTNSGNEDSNKVAMQEPRVSKAVVEVVGHGGTETTEKSNASAQDSASGSIQLNQRDIRDTFPRTASSTAAANKKMWMPQPHHSQQNLQARSVTNLNRNDDHYRHPQQYGYYVSQSSSQHDLNAENIYARKENLPVLNEKLNVSAGELLGRTHEELVLLLIQLRRQSSQTLQAIENCYNEIDSIQAQLHLMDKIKRMENLQKLEQIKQHLLELEKQYEKGKPLVNLVDNMVKLGSLYRSPQDRYNVSPYIRDRLEFNQQIQERRLLAEEKRDWDRLTPNHVQLQEKVQQLYQLDRLIQEESGTLQNLQQDKEDIERALGGLRMKLNKGFSDPAEVEQARKQQALLENELSRVHMMLAKNSKKLEETVAGNARLEQELLVLKQKLQTSRQQRSSPQFSNAGDSLPCAVGTSAMLESDLQKVQKKIGDLQKQRQELSMQVRQLTDRSNLVIKSPNSQNGQCKRKVTSCWRETDLDTMNIIDHGDGENWRSSTSPLYINTKQSESDYYNNRSTMKGSDSASDDTQTYLPPEKQEIKTVRIVKRESERRQRDREKIGNSNSNKWDALIEEDDSSQSSSVLFRPAPIQKTQSTTSISPVYEDKSSGFLSRQSSLSSPSIPQFSDSQNLEASDKSLQLSPVFKSEAARQIITEMSSNQEFPKPGQANRRAVPKEKRRHYTAPYNNMIMKSLNQLPTDDNAFDKMIMNTRRARDDLDMERALRQRIDAPDVVRSTLSNKETKFNESTIDSILGTPNKISIPERYIPEQLPQLSAEEQEHRLRKVESIKKMLSDTAIISASTSTSEDKSPDKQSNSILNKATSKIIEEKKQREHLLQLNQILAKQVMEMSKIVAGNNTNEEK